MRIAFIGQKGIPTKQGGIEKHVEELSTRLASLGFNVSVYSRVTYTGDKRKSYAYRGVNIINLPSIKTKNLDAISHTFISSVHALFQDYDIIHYHGVGPALLSFIPRIFKPSAKVIVTFHCSDKNHQKWGKFAKVMLALGEYAACIFPHETITVSKTLEKYCLYNYGTKAKYIPNGVAVDQDENLSALNELGLVKNNYIVSISRLVRHKGIHTLIKAYNQVTTNTKLVIVGDGSNTDEYVSEIKKQAEGNPNIIFAGMKSGADLAAIFKHAYLFIQPSETEGLSIALLEAMAYGVPAIISNIEENQEAAENLALEFANKSAEDLKRKLKYALDNEDIIQALARRAQERVKREYDWDIIARDTSDLYLELTAEADLVLTEAKFWCNK
ncbi:MAG: glycosyltransferase family 4 protein [Candidatus Buchananbacteria bacterium]|jgi:glycosyltransferase involved in cell wall biosynthesis